jgi:2-polyprenyl-3-methyl-5-hydroxy-6-metoxy-1,4-benzoquinol methylase
VPAVSATKTCFCRSTLWGRVARQLVLPWPLDGFRPRGQLLELGAGNGAMADGLARRLPDVRVTATDVDPVRFRARKPL